MITLLETLCSTYGAPGREEAVAAALQSALSGIEGSCRIDSLGNLLVRTGRGVSGERILVSAAMDEAALAVTYIEDQGLLRFAPVGGVSPDRLVGHRVMFASGSKGIIGCDQTAGSATIKTEQFFIDIGASDRTEVLNKVSVGDMAVLQGSVMMLGDRITAKALDNRAGCAAVAETLQRSAGSDHEIWAAFTVQGKTGFRGIRTAASQIAPSLSLSVSAAESGDTPGAPRGAAALGQGPGIRVLDGTVITHARLREHLAAIAERESIPYQWEVLSRGRSEAGPIQTSAAGIPAGALMIPARHLLTGSEMIDRRDLEDTVNLLAATLQSDWRS
ncbi:MAG: hypothetical protein WD535_01665 [Thermaerobacterales bacterium]